MKIHHDLTAAGRKGTGLLLALLLLLGQTPHISAQDAPASAPAGGSVEPLKCIGTAYGDQGDLSITSHCTEPVEAMWFFGNGHQGSASLAPGETAPTGVNVSQISELGPLRFFSCPATHPVFRDSSGGILSAPAQDYHCDAMQPHHWPPNAPRTFTYEVLTSGDCVLEHGALTFKPTGEGQWTAKIHTNRTMNRDIWHVSFNVVDAKGQPLFPVSLGDSPAMYGSPSPVIPWGIVFQFNTSQFKSIDHVIVHTSC